MKRVREAWKRKQTDAAVARAEFFPLCCMQPYLDSQPLLRLAGVSAREAHDCVVCVLSLPSVRKSAIAAAEAAAAEAAAVSDPIVAPGKASDEKHPRVCTHCKQHAAVEFDARGGVETCVNCGVVLGRICVAEFDKPPPPPRRAPRDAQRAHEPREDRLRFQRDATDAKRAVLSDAIEHWNAYLRLSVVDVERALHLALQLAEKMRAVVKAVGCMLYVRNEAHILDWLCVRDPSKPVALPPAPLSFGTCAACGENFGDMKSRRLHRCRR